MIKDWIFYKGALENGGDIQLDTGAFEPVTVPHTWNAVDGQDGCTSGKNINETDYYRGDGWYRATLPASHAAQDGKRLFLRFAGVNMQCWLYVNGQLAGSHQGGYTAFCLEITPFMLPGQNTLLAVRVNNVFSQQIAPLTADFTFYGGIYREVELLEKEAISFCRTGPGATALAVATPEVTRDKAVCTLSAVVENQGQAEKAIQVKATFDGQTEAQRHVIPAGESCLVTFLFTVEQPHLWHGRKDPYLYEAVITLWDGTAQLDDAAAEVGFRFFHVDPEKGFFLNGESYPLRGVSRHQDREGKGNALTIAEHEEDFQILYDIGATAVRLAHYPQAACFYQLCDRAGILVWAEIPFVDLVGGEGGYAQPNDDRAAFFAVTKQQLIELIRQHKQHPSIVCWGLQNEVKAKFDQVMQPFMEELHALAKQEDPTRLTTQATNQKTAHGWKSDLIAWNVYPGWYGMRRTQLGWFMDKMRAGRQPMGISEYGAGGNHLQHERRPRKPRHNGQWHPEEYQTLCHEAFMKRIEERPYLWCTFVWNLFDFGSDGRNEGDHPGMNDKGLVSFDRKVKKDAYYMYQASWSKTPMVHIAESRFTPRPQKKADLKIYSNLEQVDIYLNGKHLGTKRQQDNRQRCIFVFKNKRLAPGKNEIRAVAKQGETVAETTMMIAYNKN